MKKPIKEVRKEAKVLWAGRAWLHAHVLNKANNNKVPLVIEHKGETMTLQPTELKERFDRVKYVEDKFKPNVQHKQYGIIWKPDEK